jgi:hypothetical protein
MDMSEISGSHGSEYEDGSLHGYDTSFKKYFYWLQLH